MKHAPAIVEPHAAANVEPRAAPRRAWSLRLAGFALLFALPLALRLLPIEHGLPRNYVPDTHIVRSALGMAQEHNLVPPAGKYSHYPNLLPYLLLPLYASEYALGRASGAWHDAQGFGKHVLEHPEGAQLIARWLVALFGALTPWVVYRGTRAAGMRRGAWVAAFLVATGLLHVHFSLQERPWVPMTFFMALSAWPAALYARDGRMSRLVLSGVCAGAAFACHQGGLAAIGIPALAWLFGPLGWKPAAWPKRLLQGVACVLAFAFVGVCIGSPHLLVHGKTPVENIIGGASVEEQGGTSIGGMSIVFHVRLESFTRLSRALFGYDPVVLVFGVLGLTLALRERALRPICLFTIAWAAFFLTNQSDHVRYLLPVTVLLAWPAGLLAERWMDSAWSFRAVLLVLLFPLIQAARLDLLLTRPDTRASAERELEGLPANALVAIDRYGPDVELDRQSLGRVAWLRNTLKQPLRAREAHRKFLFDRELITADQGASAVRVEEFLDFDDRAHTVAVRPGLEALGATPADALKFLGVTHFLRVDRRPHESEAEGLQALFAGRTPVLVIDPSSASSAGARTREAFLPTEMDFPLEGLWTVDRPGPLLQLYDLRAR